MSLFKSKIMTVCVASCFNIRCNSELDSESISDYDALVLAVAHDKFKDLNSTLST